MKPRLYLILFLFCLFITSCRKNKQDIAECLIWRLNPSVASQMDLTQFVDSIFLIPLETTEKSLIKKVVSLSLSKKRLYINNNQYDIQVYDEQGNFKYGTLDFLGNGPKEYSSAVWFSVLPHDTIEIFDGLSYKMRYFLYPQGCISYHKLPEDILPAFQYKWLNQDTCFFSDPSTHNPTLKFYSKSKGKIIKTLEDKQQTPFINTCRHLNSNNGQVFISPSYPSNDFYTLDESLNLNSVFRLDFGKYNFSINNLPIGLSSKTYSDYMFIHPEYAYPFSKFALENLLIAFFQFEGQLHAAFKNRINGQSHIYKNKIGGEHQFMIPHYVHNDSLLYASEPGYLPYIVDTTLMRKTDIDKMKKVKETDNPIIVIYKMKMP